MAEEIRFENLTHSSSARHDHMTPVVAHRAGLWLHFVSDITRGLQGFIRTQFTVTKPEERCGGMSGEVRSFMSTALTVFGKSRLRLESKDAEVV